MVVNLTDYFTSYLFKWIAFIYDEKPDWNFRQYTSTFPSSPFLLFMSEKSNLYNCPNETGEINTQTHLYEFLCKFVNYFVHYFIDYCVYS